MKLAEALQTRADNMHRYNALLSRLNNNALIQEGTEPAEDPTKLLCELDTCIVESEALITRINLTNCQTPVDGQPLTALLAKRDALRLKIGAYRSLVQEGSQTARRATRSEIRILSAIDVAAVQKQIDALSKELRLLDNRIQETNWTTELL